MGSHGVKRFVRALVLTCAALATSASAASAYPTSGYTVWTVAGNGDFCPVSTSSCGDSSNPGSALSARFNRPAGLALDGAGNIYIADLFNNKVRKVTPAGAISTVAGNGTACATPTGPCGDKVSAGSAPLASLNRPQAVVLDGAGNLYIADGFDSKIRKVTPAGAISTVAGNGTACAAPTGTCGDSATPGSATSANLNVPEGLAIDSAGNLYIADTNSSKIRKVTPAGAISTIAGNGTACATPTGPCGDSSTPGSATAANLNFPQGVAIDSAGNAYVADTNDNKVREVTAAGAISTIAGNGTACPTPTGPCGDSPSPGTATSATLHAPAGVTLDPAKNLLYIADGNDNKIRKLTATGALTTIAGNGTGCTTAPNCGDGGAATLAEFDLPVGIALDGAGNLYVADLFDQEVRLLAGPQSGPQGPQGPQGATGPAGAQGATGAQGPPGQIELVRCKTVKRKHKKRQKCTTRLVSGTVKFTTTSNADRATVSRGKTVYARGVRVRMGSGDSQLVLNDLKPIRHGRYTLTIRRHTNHGWTTHKTKIRLG